MLEGCLGLDFLYDTKVYRRLVDKKNILICLSEIISDNIFHKPLIINNICYRSLKKYYNIFWHCFRNKYIQMWEWQVFLLFQTFGEPFFSPGRPLPADPFSFHLSYLVITPNEIAMNIRRPLLIAGTLVLLHFFPNNRCLGAVTTDTCDNPIQISSLIITNSACGDSAGVILISLAGGNTGYSFHWTPDVSDSNIAFGLKAGAYHIQIINTSSPACTLDTTVIINNSNGPAVQVAEVLPSNCVASNGKVTLSPASLDYMWSNGETGAVNSGLDSGCYYVTATEPGTGCYSVLKVCVPNTNPLKTTYEITEPAKCGLPAGTATVKVTGGSGQYSYSFGNTPVVSDLPPGIFTFFVVDNLTGCLDTVTIIMTEAPLSGTVNIHPFNIKCAGSGQGNVEFDVVPGPNFKTPYTFALWDANGTPQSPGSLAAGTYFLQIADADSCLLPVDTFLISEPPVFVAGANAVAATCNEGGSIQMTLTGGNGRFIVDWADLPGFDNPVNRANLQAGYYHATVYDSLFCAYPVDSVLIPSYCGTPETLLLVVGAGKTDSICLMPPEGVDAGDVSFSVVGPNNPLFGAWSLSPSGCAVYKAGLVPAFGIDPLCVAIHAPATGLSDTICIVVNITTVPPEKDSIYFAVQEGSSATACGYVPANFNNRKVSSLDGSGLNGASDAFGSYTIDPVSACITFQSFGQTGYNVDYISLAVCDTVLRQCRIICYIPTVLAQDGCSDGIFLPAGLTLSASDCDAGAESCVPVPFSQIGEYVILDNGLPYAASSFSPCNPGTVLSYTIRLNGGPYQLNEWTVNGLTYSGFFTNAYELLSILNKNDPSPGWSLEKDSVFIGGNIAQNYGPLNILSAQDQTYKVSPVTKTIAMGTVMRFATGAHEITFRRAETGCLDTIHVKVVCTGCPPLHNYTPDNQGNIVWNLSNCLSDTIFCTNIASQDLDDYSISDHGNLFSGFAACGTNIGFRLDTGFHEIKVLNNITFCEYNIKFQLNCSGGSSGQNLMAVPDAAATPKNTAVEMDLIANDIIRGIKGNRSGLSGFDILNNPDFGQLTYDDFFAKVTYHPEHDFCGIDTFTYQITDTTGLRSSALVKVTVLCDKVLIYNGISPNGDGKNDVWHIAGIELYPDNEVRIFNRWGNLVFEQKSYTNQHAWDGTWNGHYLPDGTYFYQIDLGDGEKPMSGYLQILR